MDPKVTKMDPKVTKVDPKVTKIDPKVTKMDAKVTKRYPKVTKIVVLYTKCTPFQQSTSQQLATTKGGRRQGRSLKITNNQKESNTYN